MNFMNDKYILIDKKVILEPDLMKWGRWMEDAKRHVGNDELSDGTWISTVFLGLDHSFGNVGLPLVFETMVFPDGHNKPMAESEMWRYYTYKEAEAGHAKAVKKYEKLITK